MTNLHDTSITGLPSSAGATVAAGVGRCYLHFQVVTKYRIRVIAYIGVHHDALALLLHNGISFKHITRPTHAAHGHKKSGHYHAATDSNVPESKVTTVTQPMI